MLKISHSNDFSRTNKFLSKLKSLKYDKILSKYGELGVEALRYSTPVDTGKTSESWYYKINYGKDTISICWCNSNVVDGIPIAILLQYGHATRNGGYVMGTDYINPALQDIFKKIRDELWKEVTDK